MNEEAAVDPDRLENLGIVVVVLGITAAVAGTWALAGWPWALIVFAVLALAGGTVVIRTAALTPPPKPEKPEGGEVS